MINWAEAGRKILAQDNLDPQERVLMEARVQDAESAGLVFEYKRNPTSPEAVTNFWQTFIRVSIQHSEAEIDVPEIPPCDRTQEELEALRQEGRMMVYNPGFSYPVHGKIFPKMNSYSVKEDSPIKDKETKSGWVDVEMDIDSPNTDTKEDDLEKIFKSQGRKGMRLATYILGGQASKVLTGKYFDQGSTYSRLLSSSFDGYVVDADFYSHGLLNVGWALDPQAHAPGLGGRSEGVKRT